MMENAVYMLFVDESGTNDKKATFILGGVAVHESVMPALSRRLDRIVETALKDTDVDRDSFELHASEIRNPGKKSPWKPFSPPLRQRTLTKCYESLGAMPDDGMGHDVVFFGVAMDSRFRSQSSEHDRERVAYEHLLKKFDDFLARSTGSDMGWVVHDQRIVAEKDVRQWTRGWQEAAGALGPINRFADLPLFADSRATRLLQVADLVAYALWRSYDQGDDQYVGPLWPLFDTVRGRMHGAIHLTPDFADLRCTCKPCRRRITGNVEDLD